MADPPYDPFTRGILIPPTVIDDVLDSGGHSDWDALEHYVFTEITDITMRYSKLCDAAEQGDASAIPQVTSLLRLQADLLQASGWSSWAEFIDSILGPNLLERTRAWYLKKQSNPPLTSDTTDTSDPTPSPSSK